MKKALYFYLLRRGLLTGAGGFIRDGLVMASKFITQGLTHPAQGSAEFDGASDYVTMGDVLNQGTANATYSFWAYVEADNGGQCALAKSNGGSLGANYGFLAGVFLNGKIQYYTADSDPSTYGGQASHAGLNEWQYISFVVDKSQSDVGIYINGSKQTTTRILGGALSAVGDVTNTLPLVIGAESDLSNKFDGNLANVAIWNRALSSDEINSVMWKAAGSLTDSEKNGLQAWYRLDDISGTSVPDSSGNGNNGTAN